MYNPDLKIERINAQIKALNGFGIGFRKAKNNLTEMLRVDEDIYGFLVGFNESSANWEIIVCTNYNIYLIEKQKMFNLSMKQHDVKSIRGIEIDRNMFKNYTLSLKLGKDYLVFSNCLEPDVSNFRNALTSAQHKSGLPYQFDAEPYKLGYINPNELARKEFQKQRELELNEEKEELRLKALKEKEDLKEKEKLGDLLRNGTSSNYKRNVYLYPTYVGEGFVEGDNGYELDTEYQQDAFYFEKLSGVEPKQSDYGFLYKNKSFVEELIQEDEFKTMVSFGRKGKLYLLKNEYGKTPYPEDYLTEEDVIEDNFSHKEPVSERQERLLKNNHFASRFVEQPDVVVEQEPIQEETPIEQEDFIEFDINFSELSVNQGKIIDKEVEKLHDLPTVSQMERLDVDPIDTLSNEHIQVNESPNEQSKEFKQLLEYKQLLDMGIISEKEFEYKKRELLGLPE